MADESLGHIDLRVITDAVTKGTVGETVGMGQNAASAITQGMAKMVAATTNGMSKMVTSVTHAMTNISSAIVRSQTNSRARTTSQDDTGTMSSEKNDLQTSNALSALPQAMSKMSSAVDVIRMGMRGASVGDIASAGMGIAQGAGPSAAALAGLAISLGVVATAAFSIKSAVTSIQGRISELARVNAGMAQQEALNQIADIRRDMAEARVLGPLYAKVSEIMRSLKDAIQPFLILFKGLFTAIIIPILNGLVSMLNGLAKYIPWILQFIIAAFQQLSFMANIISVFLADLATYFTDIATPLNGLATGFSLLGFGVTTIIGQLGQVLNNLNQQQGAQSPNQWAINTLNALSSGGALTPALVPAGPTAPGYNPKKPKVNP